ncbi:MAG TPA: DUF5989 family protein [candidate division Zixibacteria bacterium]|nr:DUF5989 family protein [candidate division Zixibacteria bacterium]
MSSFGDLIGFFKHRKKYWLAPAIVVLVLLGVLIVLAGSSALGPFIYTLF